MRLQKAVSKSITYNELELCGLGVSGVVEGVSILPAKMEGYFERHYDDQHADRNDHEAGREKQSNVHPVSKAVTSQHVVDGLGNHYTKSVECGLPLKE
jgi:hypothetical protein